MQTLPPAHNGPGALAIGPTTSSERSLAPDMARGAVLLGIALANVGIYLYGREFGVGQRPVDGSALDRALDFVVTFVVNDRSRPMFALLFGFGLATMLRRMTERGASPRQRMRVLVRRNIWLIAFGAVHAALLFEGDILGIYGATGLVVLALMNRRPRVLVAWAALSVVTLGLLYGLVAVFFEFTPMPADYLAAVVERLTLWGFGVLFGTVVLFMLAPMLIGVVMSRSGLLDRPWEHVPRLRRLAAVGGVVGLAGSLPYALIVARVWQPDVTTTALLSALHAITGIAMGVAYVCLFALWAARRHGSPATRSPATRSLATGSTLPWVLSAVGQRSLTCYLLQSVMLAPLLSPWGLELGATIGTAQAYGIALVVWLVTVGVACVLAATGRRGPFEVLLRRLTYGRPAPADRQLSAHPVPITSDSKQLT